METDCAARLNLGIQFTHVRKIDAFYTAQRVPQGLKWEGDCDICFNVYYERVDPIKTTTDPINH